MYLWKSNFATIFRIKSAQTSFRMLDKKSWGHYKVLVNNSFALKVSFVSKVLDLNLKSDQNNFLALRCFVWVITIHFLNVGVACIKIRNIIVENHIQAWYFSIWSDYFRTKQLFSTHTKQRRALIFLLWYILWLFLLFTGFIVSGPSIRLLFQTR